jgi:hypothetical protein
MSCTESVEERLVVRLHLDAAGDGVEGGHHGFELADVAGLHVAVANGHPHDRIILA